MDPVNFFENNSGFESQMFSSVTYPVFGIYHVLIVFDSVDFIFMDLCFTEQQKLEAKTVWR